ncbi:MAG: transporter substrate-binding domain-containing protein [Geminocystis sp.]|nr:transporter substrate-binding domain-containing protein [Geminocystis sp.]HIK38052.1 transporter substrate-binding domain-containing protein [Geminocystis sp. M7585_C2015_104]MCS7146910.1 transporter substrate-binding domain-containing protein [Geminocystis sp.]MCX8078929.1 transporter substrate-binding domain-containing protein [Geminocystis sp.]MDW8115734.1 transporter substrate-binding domain-containing protein [Geminocystis sp.]
MPFVCRLLGALGIGSLLLGVWWGNNAILAQEGGTKKVIVATKVFPPLVFEEKGKYTGFSIELWEAVAKQLNWEWEIYGEKTVDDLLEAVERGIADVAIAGVTITAERDKRVDFSYPYFESGLQILVSKKGFFPLEGFVSFIFSPLLWTTTAVVFVCVFMAANIVWWLEKEENAEMFPRDYNRGIIESIWWAVVTLLTVGYGDKTPKSIPGRIVATIWMFSSVLLISYFTASITSILTVQQLSSNISSVGDLGDKLIGTVANTFAADYLKSQKVNLLLFNSIDEAYTALEEEKVRAVVYDAPVLRYYAITRGRGKVGVVGNVFARQSYGIVFRQGSPYRELVNQALLTIQEDGTYERIYQKWFGTQ